MTAPELINHLNRVFGINPWPKQYEVDAATYGHCCQAVFNEYKMPLRLNERLIISLSVGENGGLMFKNVELILK